MGADTKGFVKSNVAVEDLVRVIKKEIAVGEVIVDSRSYTTLIVFTTRNDEKHALYSHTDAQEQYTNGEKVTLFSVSHHGEAENIVKTLVSAFGGHYLANDCDDDCEWEYIPSNGKGFDLTEQDILEKKLYDKLTESNLTYNEKNNMIKFIISNLDWVKTL